MNNLLRFIWPFSTNYASLSADDIYRELRGISLSALLWPIISGSLLLYSGLSLTDHQKWIGVLLVVPAGVVLLLIVGNRLLQKDFEPISLFLGTSPDQNEQKIGRDALICARNFQTLSLRRILLFQTPAFGLGFSIMTYLGNQFLSFDLELWQLLVALMVSAMVGIGHAVFEFYAITPLMNHLTAMLHQQGLELTAEDRKQIIRVDTKRKLMFVSGLTMSAPMLILGTTLLIRVNHDLHHALLPEQASAIMPGLISWMLLIVVISSIMSLLISLRMAQDTTNSTRELSAAMRQVEAGHLDISLFEKSSDEYAGIFRRFNRMVRQLMERERLRDAFGRYVSKELTEDVMQHGVNLGGQSLTVTIMFTDVRGFCAISESLLPEEVVKMLNIYLEEMTHIVNKHSGTINELMGDGMLIVFGAPTAHCDDAERAIACAMEMQLAMPQVNARIAAMGFPELEMGIGLNSGKVVAGNVGSDMRTKYAVVGSAVNMAARVESFTVGGQVLVTHSTLDLVSAELDVAGEFSTTFKGIKEPVTMYDISGIEGDYNLSLPKLEIKFLRLLEPLPVQFEEIKGKISDSGMTAASLLALSENGKHGILATPVHLELRTNVKLSLQTTLLPEDTQVYGKVMKVNDNGNYEVNFTFLSKDTRNFFRGSLGNQAYRGDSRFSKGFV